MNETENSRTRVRVKELVYGRDNGRQNLKESGSESNASAFCKKSCCLGGTAFFDALKAMITR